MGRPRKPAPHCADQFLLPLPPPVGTVVSYSVKEYRIRAVVITVPEWEKLSGRAWHSPLWDHLIPLRVTWANRPEFPLNVASESRLENLTW